MGYEDSGYQNENLENFFSEGGAISAKKFRYTNLRASIVKRCISVECSAENAWEVGGNYLPVNPRLEDYGLDSVGAVSVTGVSILVVEDAVPIFGEDPPANLQLQKLDNTVIFDAGGDIPSVARGSRYQDLAIPAISISAAAGNLFKLQSFVAGGAPSNLVEGKFLVTVYFETTLSPIIAIYDWAPYSSGIRAVDNFGDPVENVTFNVYLQSTAWGLAQIQQVTSGADGLVTLSGHPGNTYIVTQGVFIPGEDASEFTMTKMIGDADNDVYVDVLQA